MPPNRFSYRAFMKKKLRLTRSTSHTILHSHLLYNLTNLHHRLIAAHSESLLLAINDNNLLLASSPLLCWPYTTPSKDSDWVTNALCKWNKSAITIQIPTTFHNIIKGGNIPLHTLSYSHGRSMLTFADLSLQESLSNPITGELHQKVPHLKECYFNFMQPNKIPSKQSFIVEASISTFNNNENTPTNIEVETTSTSSSQDKGKGPEQIIPPSWADETEAELSHHHDNKYQPSPLDSISTQLINISQQLADIHNQLSFTLTRVNTIETVLNITSISPEQADIINNNKYKNPLDDMEEKDNEDVTAGIDISKSIVRQQESQVTELQLENSILKSNLSDNYEKLNNTLVAVAQMQRLLIHHELLPENHLINITELIKPAPSDYFNDN
ncbi:12121_t:CDS:2, partial [Funneliformis geosporum]